MATISKGFTFGATETVTNAKLHTLVDGASITGISNSDIASDAAIDSSKINFTLSDYVTIAGDQTITGSKTFSGTTTFSTALANTNLAAITQASKVSGTSFYALASCISGAGQLPRVNQALQDIDALLPSQTGNSGKVLTTDGTDSSWGAAGTSNVIFCWNGYDGDETGVGMVFGAKGEVTLLEDIGTQAHNNFYLGSGSVTNKVILRSKFLKVAGISTVTIQARLWNDYNSANAEAVLTVDVGGQNNTVKNTNSQTPGWVTASNIDVSSLTNGTTYDITISLLCEDENHNAYCSAVILIAS
jgi:hypothetical protein